jgi:hypothetical protein
MNLSHSRFARRTGGGRPGAPVCNPGEPANNVGMLGGAQTLYNNPSSRPVNTRQRTVNGLEILNNQGDRINRLERKLEQIEQQYAISTSGVELKVDNTAKKIDLVKGEYIHQMKIMRSYIKQLEEKIKLIDGGGSIEKTKTVESVKKSVDQENITLEITDK